MDVDTFLQVRSFVASFYYSRFESAQSGAFVIENVVDGGDRDDADLHPEGDPRLVVTGERAEELGGALAEMFRQLRVEVGGGACVLRAR